MVNYQNGRIYKLCSDVDDKIYIGSTTIKLCQRFSDHKTLSKKVNSKVYKHFKKIHWENVRIILLEKYPCESKEELLMRERFWQEKLKPKLNTNNAITTKNEVREQSKKRNQKYYKKHKDEDDFKKRNHLKVKKYYESHKEQINARRRQRKLEKKQQDDV